LLNPDFLEAHVKLGTQYLQMNEPLWAAKQFNKAAEINDRVIDAYIGLSGAYKASGNSEEALSTLSLAAAIQPNTAFLVSQATALRFCASNPVEFSVSELIGPVIEAHRKERVKSPNDAELHYRVGLLLMSVVRLDEAMESFRQTLRINPTCQRARSKLAVCLHETGRKEQALDQIGAAYALDKNTLDMHYKTAILYSDRVKFASTLLNLQRQMQENLSDMDSTKNVSVVLQNLGLIDRAAAMWDNMAAMSDSARI
jgi:tetratricopeptide (TPR) repeat protein